MKKLRALLSLVAILSLALNSCQKPIVFVAGSGPGSGSSGSQQFSFKGKIDGVLLECPISNATFYPAAAGGGLQIMGNKGVEGFGFTIMEYKGAGSYDLTDITKASGVYLKDSTDPINAAYTSTSGTLVISIVTDKVIKGTFNFKGTSMAGQSKTITDGSFVINLAPVVAPPPAAGDKSMSAKIDGTLMSFTAEGHNIKGPLIGNTMSVIGTNGVKSMAIAIDGYNGVGTYEYQGATSASYNIDSSFSGIYEAEFKSGKIIITSATATNIKGTFSFLGRNPDPSINDTKNITEGKFDVKVTTMTMP